MLRIDRALYEEIVAHARRDHPDEACGIVAMKDGRATRVIPMTNVERSPTFYNMDSGEVLQVMRSFDAHGEDDEEFVIYHSHTATEAYPSPTDRKIAGYPEAHYALISTREPDTEEFRSYRIVDGEVTEEPVEII